MKLTKSTRGIAAAAMAGAAFAVGLSAAQAQEPFRLIVTELEAPLVPNSVMILADQLGYYEAEGVNVELVQVTDTPLAVSALQAGEGEMANISTDSALLLTLTGQLEHMAVASPNKFLPFLIACQEGIGSVADMAGRSFGVARVGSLDYTLSSMVMNSNGLSPDDVEFVAIGAPPARGEALAAGQIDCTTMSIGVWLGIPDRSGLEIVVPVGTYGDAAPVVNKVNIVPSEVLDNRRDDVVAVVTALIKISRDFAENPQLWVDAMLVARPDQTEETLQALAEAFEGAWSVNGGLNADELSFAVGEIAGGDDFADMTAPELDDWVDFSIIDDVLAELGADDTADAPVRP